MLRKLPKIENMRSFIATGIGVAMAQAISLLSIPLIAKMSGPQTFGDFSYLYSWLIVALVFSTLKLEFAVYVLSRDNIARLRNIFKLILPVMAFFISIALTLLALQYVPAMVANAILLFSSFFIFLFFAGYFEFVIQDNVKQGKFKLNAELRIIRAFSVPSVFYLISCFFDLSAESIIITFSISNAIPVLYDKKENGSSLFYNSSVTDGFSVFKKCKDTVNYLVPAHFIARYSSTSLILLTGTLGVSSEQIAKYVLVEKLLIAPVSIVTAAVSDVVKREISKDPLSGLKNYYRLCFYTAIVSAVAVVVILTVFDEVVLFAMGDGWGGINDYAIYLLPYMISLLVLSPITHVYTVLRRQKYDLAWQVFHAVITTAAIYIGLQSGFSTAVLYFSLSASVSLLISALICRHFVLTHKPE
ncbi:hypothetical protein LZU85_14705 [Vibrio sp. IRLE0018]|uniref:lipopolysaccharide biosynthesis protein n=1 Tax=Vibrio floridensis TaxID=2908007 RepID=UPI001F19B3CC|nr:hypothetical protein [Vibrio floridensis]MCF8780055.1 hypothetical protein [Vibrio floridensis]